MAGYGRSGNSPVADRASKRAALRHCPRPYRGREELAVEQGHRPVGETVAGPCSARRESPRRAEEREDVDRLGWRHRDAATITITTRRNNAVWAKPACTADLAERAVFVHRLITSRKYAGLGLGAELIDWAGLRGCREYGAKWIRIDVWRTNTGLHDYYKSKGFKPCGTCADPDYPSGALFRETSGGNHGARLARSLQKPLPTHSSQSPSPTWRKPPSSTSPPSDLRS